MCETKNTELVPKAWSTGLQKQEPLKSGASVQT